MFSDAEDETSRPKTESMLTMGDFQYQVPRSLSPSSASPPSSSTHNLPFSLKSLSLSGSSSELVEFPNNGFDFYSSSFDNLYPYRGVILSNEQTFSCSTPTSNTSFHTEMSFNNSQPFLNNTPDSGVAQSDGCGLLTITSSPFHGNDHGHRHGHENQQMSGINGGDVGNFVVGGGGGGGGIGVSSFLTPHANSMAMNDSGLSPSPIGHVGQRWESPKTATSTVSKSHFDFSLPFSEASISSSGSSNGSNSSASADSPSRITSGGSGAMQNPWDIVDLSTLDNDGPCASSMIAPLGDSIWSPTHGSIMSNRAGNAPDSGFPLLDDALTKLNKKQLLALVDLLKDKHDELIRTGEPGGAAHVQSAMVKVQEFIISSYVSEPTGNLCSVGTPKTTDGPPSLLPSPKENSLERVVKMHKEIAGSKDAPYTWSGQLPPRIHRNPVYSSKVFLGGLPWDITESTLMQAFKPFGITKIEWPGKDGYTGKPKGYAYAVFDSDKQVKMLLQNCTLDYSNSRSGNYYFKISSKKYRGKDVQIIPWAMSDSNFVRCQASKIDPLKTVFVGALHGMVNAEGLATIMNDLFDNVIYAGIDTDRTKYPIGSARVTFNSTRSYMKAVTAAFVLIKTSRFEKKLQVDPYLEDATCSVCNLQQGPYFCRDSACFSYFCRTCFQYKHAEGPFRAHRPMMRTTHNKQHMGFNGFHQQSYNSGNNSFNGGNNGAVNNNNGNGNMSGGGGHHHHFNGHQQNGGGNGGHNFHHQTGYGGNGHHYSSSNNNRQQWSNGNNNAGGMGLRSTHAMNQLNQLHNFMSSSGGGSGTKYINCGNGAGGQQGGGALNLGNSNAVNGSIMQGQLPGNNRNFGHRQQPHYARW